ncbi:MAG: CDP-diacylglycerol diphosphatase [Nevskia sp.]|nr:CDP-diacylglycerol diphosphatase [Nevskia sp.]
MRLRSWRSLLLGGVLAAALAGCHGDSDALWKIVHQRCVPDQVQHGNPAPCVLVELAAGEAQGDAVLKDRNGPYQYLLIATAPVSGIESPLLTAAGAPPYFAAAWRARRFVEQSAQRSLPREALSLAINSEYGRSQNQLHIHIDCLKPAVRDALQAQLHAIGPVWAPLPAPLEGHQYRAMRLSEAQFEQANPFALLAGSPEPMARHTLVAAGATFEDGTPGLILLDHTADLWRLDRGHGEELQNHSCS